jgi:hypothetical protein
MGYGESIMRRFAGFVFSLGSNVGHELHAGVL